MKHALFQFPRARRDRIGGFTLVELLVVLVILSLVMGLVGPRVLSYLSSSRERAAKLQIKAFDSTLNLFFLDNGRYPTETEGLAALVTAPTGAERWGGPYLQQLPPDPWGNPYHYSAAGAASKTPYLIVSYGSDGQKGGSDEGTDITNAP
jgi:general secretion pathway protein G